MLLEAYASTLQDMREVHGGTALRHAADLLRQQLPAGRLVLLATSIEGVAIAAACAAERAPLPTRWERLSLVVPAVLESDEVPVVIEPADGGTGWRRTIERQYPNALFLFSGDHRVRLAA